MLHIGSAEKDGKISYIVGAVFGDKSKDECAMLFMNICKGRRFNVVDGRNMTRSGDPPLVEVDNLTPTQV